MTQGVVKSLVHSALAAIAKGENINARKTIASDDK
jgi:hypothetical protein